MSEPTINTSVSLQILRQAYTNQVLKTVIPRNTDLRDAHFQKQDILCVQSPRQGGARLRQADPGGLPMRIPIDRGSSQA